MSHAEFIHLRVHSAYSLAEGAVRVKDLSALCQRHEMPAIGISDTGNLFGALEISEILSGQGIQPLIGCSLAVDVPELHQLADTGFSVGAKGKEIEPARIALIAMNERGYLNLMELVSRAFLDTDSVQIPHVSWEKFILHTEGLICLTGGPDGALNRLLVGEKKGLAEKHLAKLHGLFGDRVYVELQRHNLPNEIKAETGLIDLAYDLEIPIVATNEVYFPDREMFEAHDALLCVAEGTYQMEEERRHLSAEHYFKSPKEMAALFADLPEAIENTIEIAKRVTFRPKTIPPILPSYGGDDADLDEAEELRRQSEEGLKAKLEKYGTYTEEKAYWDRLEYELGIINSMEFPGYFLIVSDFMKWTRAQGIPVGVRGSGAASIVAWAMDITNLDPLRFDLVFERFLNPERISMPDFDIDFCQERRHEVIEYVQEKYGFDRVAQIITYGKMQARMVVRDVGRVLQMPYGQVDRLCRLIPSNPANPMSLKEALDFEPRLREAREEEEVVDRLFEIALVLEGLYRNASTHAAGVVIGDRPLQELVPLYRDPRSEMPVTQFSMKWVEPAGLVKFDFLGLKTLTVIARTEGFLAERDIHINTQEMDFDDRLAFELLSKGDSVGVFQLESSGMQDLLRKMKPDRIEDLIALVALYRPGPMDSIPKYIACKHGREEPEYLHPMLVPILEETFGVMTYQEDVMQIARDLAGYSLGEADLLRRAMGKKIKSEMDKHQARFIEGAVERGIEKEIASGIFDQAAKFASYGFNKAHAAAYAQVAYQTGYLKANYPVEFMAALMSLDLGNTDKLNVIKQEASRLGIKINTPDINTGKADFSVANGEVVYGLAAIKNVGRHAMEHLVEVRDKGGPFKDLYDFATRIDPKMINRRIVENLGKAGAFDKLNPNRAQVVEAADLLINHAHVAAEERVSAQNSLFGDDQGLDARNIKLPLVEQWLPMEQLTRELEAIGFYLSGHPLDDYQAVLKQSRVVSLSDLLNDPLKLPKRVLIAGTVITKQERKSQKTGNPYAFVNLTDPTGQFEVMVFSEALGEYRDLLEPGNSVVLSVDTQWEGSEEDGEQLRMFAKSVKSLADVTANAGGLLKVFVDHEAPLPSIKDRLDRMVEDMGGGKGRIGLVLMLGTNGREVELELPHRLNIDPSLKAMLRSVDGVVEVQEI